MQFPPSHSGHSSAISAFFFPVKLAHSSPNKFPEPFTESLLRPNETSRKERGHRKTELSQHKGKTLLLQSVTQLSEVFVNLAIRCFARSRDGPSEISASQDQPGSKSEKRSAQVAKSFGKSVSGATWTNPKEQHLPELLRTGRRPGAVGKSRRRRKSREM